MSEPTFNCRICPNCGAGGPANEPCKNCSPSVMSTKLAVFLGKDCQKCAELEKENENIRQSLFKETREKERHFLEIKRLEGIVFEQAKSIGFVNKERHHTYEDVIRNAKKICLRHYGIEVLI